MATKVKQLQLQFGKGDKKITTYICIYNPPGNGPSFLENLYVDRKTQQLWEILMLLVLCGTMHIHLQ
jgi:hypothetical protein